MIPPKNIDKQNEQPATLVQLRNEVNELSVNYPQQQQRKRFVNNLKVMLTPQFALFPQALMQYHVTFV